MSDSIGITEAGEADPARPAPKGARAYFAASAVSQVSALVRYTVLARLLGPEQLGLAATIILTLQFFDSVSDSGADRFLIQHKDGDSVELQKLVQLVLSVRGAVAALTLVVLAVPIAALYGTPALVPGFMTLALSPLIAGFVHLDMRRLQRQNDFRPESVNVLVSEVLMTLTMIVAAYFLRNFTAILYGIIARSITAVVVSRLVARRPYRIGFSPAHTTGFALFAMPLMLNGLVLFLGGQGDRIFVGNRLGPTELGEYSAVTLLAYYPTMAVAKYVGSMHLPRIAGGRDLPRSGLDAIEVFEGQTLTLSMVMLVGFAIVGPIAVAILFGPKFAQAGLVFGLIGAMQVTRFARMWPTTVALARGRSGVVLTTNIVRLTAFPAAIAAYILVGGIAGIVIGFIVGDLLAQVVGIIMINATSPDTMRRGFDRMGILVATGAAVIGWELALPHPTFFAIAGLSIASALIAALFVMHERVTLQTAYRYVGAMTRLKALAP